ncbi:hypothetical protein Tco_1166890 [Tanacetum coccineum]
MLSLSPMFDSQHFFPLEKISPPKDVETPIESPIPISPSVGSLSPVRSTIPPPDYPFDKSILDNSLWIIPQPLGSEQSPRNPIGIMTREYCSKKNVHTKSYELQPFYFNGTKEVVGLIRGLNKLIGIFSSATVPRTEGKIATGTLISEAAWSLVEFYAKTIGIRAKPTR